jgi:hypothetical protein
MAEVAAPQPLLALTELTGTSIVWSQLGSVKAISESRCYLLVLVEGERSANVAMRVLHVMTT